MQIDKFFKGLDNNHDNYQAVGIKYLDVCENVSDLYTYSYNISCNEWDEHNNEVLEFLLKNLSIRNVTKETLKSLHFVAHKSVISNLRSWFWHIYSLVVRNFGEEYVDEKMIIKLFFCMRDDLNIKLLDEKRAIVKNNQKVSVIVTARNNGKYLAECLSSCINQSVRPFEIIYFDDGSTDNSVKIAGKFKEVYVYASKHLGVCKARNEAVALSKGDILIHVDGDDILTYDFIKKHLDAFDKNPTAPFVYGPAQYFGSNNQFFDPPEWDKYFIWDMNICNTSSAIKREYFDAVGGWKECTGGNFWDWNLFLRISRYNKPAKSNAVLLYRRHESNWSKVHLSKINIKRVRQELVKLSIGCVYSGRLPGLLPRWFKSLIDNIKHFNIVEPIEFVIIDNSSKKNGKLLQQEARKYTKYFKSLKILKLEKKAEYSDKNAVSTLLAEAYTSLLVQTDGEIVFFLEDDITFSNNNQLQKLFDTLTYQMPLYAGVSGSYRNRHCEESKRVAGYVKDNCYISVTNFSIKETKVDITGTGCLMFWRDLGPNYFEPFIKLHGQNIPAHDWWFTANMADGRTKILQTDVKLKHWQTEDKYLI